MEDIDFDNFSVDQERATEIRKRIEFLKGQNLVNDLKLLCMEFGYEVEIPGEQESLPGLTKGQKDLCFEICALNNQADYKIDLSGNEMRFLMAGSLVCDVTFLPKDNEILVGFVNPDLWTNFQSEYISFESILNLAKKKKSERQKLWKDRFTKAE